MIHREATNNHEKQCTICYGPAYQGENRGHVDDALVDGLVQSPIAYPPRQPPNVQLKRPALGWSSENGEVLVVVVR